MSTNENINQTKKSFIIFWISILIFVILFLISHYYYHTFKVNHNFEKIVESNLSLQSAQHQFDNIQASKSNDIDFFHLENLDELMLIPKIDFYKDAEYKLLETKNTIPMLISSRNSLYSSKFLQDEAYKTAIDKLTSLSQISSKDSLIKNQASQIIRYINEINSSINYAFDKNQVNTIVISMSIDEISHKVKFFDDKKSKYYTQSQMIKMTWDDYLKSTTNLLASQNNYQHFIQKISTSLIELRTILDNGYKKHLAYIDYLGITTLLVSIVILLAILILLYSGASNFGLKDLIGSNNKKIYESEMNKISIEIGKLISLINESWVINTKETNVITNAINDTEKNIINLNNINLETKANIFSQNRKNDLIIGNLKSIQQKITDINFKKELELQINNLDIVIEDNYTQNLEVLNTIDNIKMIQYENLSTLKLISKLIDHIEKDTSAMKNEARELKKSQKIISSV